MDDIFDKRFDLIFHGLGGIQIFLNKFNNSAADDDAIGSGLSHLFGVFWRADSKTHTNRLVRMFFEPCYQRLDHIRKGGSLACGAH